MRNKLVHSLVASSMEELQEDLSSVAPVPVADEPLDLGEDVVQEMERDAEDVEHLEEAAVALENLRDVMEEALEEGGLNPQAERVATVAVNNVRRQLGLRNLTAPRIEEPALESAMPATVRTQMSMESVTQTLREMARAVIEFVKRIWRQIADFFKRVFSATERMKQRAKKVYEQVQVARREKYNTEADTVEMGRNASYFESMDGGRIADFLRNVSKQTATLSEKSLQHAGAYSDYAAEMMEANRLKAKIGTGFVSMPASGVIKLDPSLFPQDGKSESVDGVPYYTYRTPVLPGRVQITCRRPDLDQAQKLFASQGASGIISFLKHLGRDRWTLTPVNETSGDPKQPKVRDLGALEDIVVAAIDTFEDMTAIGEDIRKADRENAARIRKLEPIMVKLGVGHLPFEKSLEKYILESSRAFQRIQRAYTGSSVVMSQYLIRAAGVYVSYVEKCMETYGAGKEAPASKPLKGELVN